MYQDHNPNKLILINVKREDAEKRIQNRTYRWKIPCSFNSTTYFNLRKYYRQISFISTNVQRWKM